jgi:hypothetical protein
MTPDDARRRTIRQYRRNDQGARARSVAPSLAFEGGPTMRGRAAVRGPTKCLAGVVAALLGGACTAPPGDAAVPVRVAWATPGGPPGVVYVTVTADDPPWATTVRSTSGAVVVRVPAGSSRTFFARALDADGTVTHAGAVTIDVSAAAGPAILPLRGTAGADEAEMSVAALAPALAEQSSLHQD